MRGQGRRGGLHLGLHELSERGLGSVVQLSVREAHTGQCLLQAPPGVGVSACHSLDLDGPGGGQEGGQGAGCGEKQSSPEELEDMSTFTTGLWP